MLCNLKIDNFRGIKSLEIEKLGKVNLFIGYNNCCKTTVLESVFLLSKLDQIEAVLSIENYRVGSHSNYKSLNSMFHLTSDKFSLSGNFENHKRMLDVSFEDFSTIKKKLNYDFQVKNKEYHSDFIFHHHNDNSTSIDIKNDTNFTEMQNHSFIHSHTLNHNPNTLSELIKEGKKEKIITLLKKVDSKISTFEVLPDGTVYFALDGYEKLIPIYSIGDGVKRLFSFAVEGFTWKKNLFFCIDELENGIHHSLQKEVWNFLFNCVKEQKCQLFISTHSKEIIQSFSKALVNSELENDSFIHHLYEKDYSKHQIATYSYDEFSSMISSDNELRGF